jgi:hypothetical protein
VQCLSVQAAFLYSLVVCKLPPQMDKRRIPPLIKLGIDYLVSVSPNVMRVRSSASNFFGNIPTAQLSVARSTAPLALNR